MWNRKKAIFSQTQLKGDRKVRHSQTDWSNACPSCNTDLWIIMLYKGGVLLYGCCLRSKRSRCVSFTLLTVLDWSYMMTTNSSSLNWLQVLSHFHKENLRTWMLLWRSQTHFRLSMLSFYLLKQMLTLYHKICIHERMTVLLALDQVI